MSDRREKRKITIFRAFAKDRGLTITFGTIKKAEKLDTQLLKGGNHHEFRVI